MNERILELIKQADIEFDVSSDHYGVDTAVVIPYDLEKFAELIVRECADIAFDEYAATNGEYSGASAILEHFGVSE